MTILSGGKAPSPTNESKIIITFNEPGSAEFGTSTTNVTPAQLIALGAILEHQTVRITQADLNGPPAESVLEVVFESPGSARCQIVKHGLVEIVQIMGAARWLDWYGRQYFTAGAAREAREAREKAQKQKSENQILVPSMMVKQ